MAIYLDCNATTPLESEVQTLVARFLERDFGNAASPIHDYGVFARMAVEQARRQIATVVAARPDEVIITSGATEALNLALLGLAEHGLASGRRHILTTTIEHKAVLEPLATLARRGFDVEILPVSASGRLDAQLLAERLRPETLLVAMQQVNNETGILQPVAEVGEILAGHDAYWVVDAAQGYGKEIAALRQPRIDLIAVSAHKLYAPKGVGVLVARRRDNELPPLTPLMYGGGQEQGLRPGTLPVALIAGLGAAAKLALRDHEERAARCRDYRQAVLAAFSPFCPVVNGDQNYVQPHVINLALPGIPAAETITALKNLIAVSSTSACTAHTHAVSHVLTAMGLHPRIAGSAIRLSWSHLTPPADWDEVGKVLKRLCRRPTPPRCRKATL